MQMEVDQDGKKERQFGENRDFCKRRKLFKKIINILKKIKQDIANMKQTGCNKN